MIKKYDNGINKICWWIRNSSQESNTKTYIMLWYYYTSDIYIFHIVGIVCRYIYIYIYIDWVESI